MSRVLDLAAPIERWDEAIPLGNGLMGSLLWGGDNRLKLSLDRGDLWDLRPVQEFQKPDWTWKTLQRLVRQRDQAEILRRFDGPYKTSPHPTKIPGGRLELTLDRSVHVSRFHLDMTRATGKAQWPGGRAEVFCSAAEPVGLIRVRGSAVRLRIAPPLFGGPIEQHGSSVNTSSLSALGYPAPEHGSSRGLTWVVQHGVDGMAFAIVVGRKRLPNSTLIAYSVASTQDGPDPVAIGSQRVRDALAKGWEQMRKPHLAWWRAFCKTSNLKLPDVKLEQHYNLVQYFYGSASRRGAPPIPLQGVWTADEGKLPPWKGDYHHDLNTQLTYWAYLGAGHFEEGLCFLDYLWNLLPSARRFAKKFYGTPGACLPGVSALDGQPLGGWSQYTVTPSNSVWLAHSFYTHWQYTRDEDFLRQRAYPWCTEIGNCVASLLKPDRNGWLRLPLSASPEFHDNTLKAWMPSNTNHDLALLRWFFAALREMAWAAGDRTGAKRWQTLHRQLEDFARIANGQFRGALMLSRDEALTESHRHHAHLMPIFPLGLISIEGTDADRQTIEASLAQIDKLGTGYWCGYSFAWMSCLAARAGQSEKAAHMLDLYLRATVSRNGFHLNGDFKNIGVSLPKYRPFTLEGNFAAARAVQEMLLQTWGGVVRLFPAVPESWQDVSFDGLHGEMALKISAKRRAGQTQWFRIEATHACTIQVRDPFNSASVTWSRPDMVKRGPNYHIAMTPGQVLEAHRQGGS